MLNDKNDIDTLVGILKKLEGSSIIKNTDDA
jgi:hypothetical protein